MGEQVSQQVSQLRVHTWEAWLEGEHDSTIEHDSLFASSAAAMLGRRYCPIGKTLTVCVREKGNAGQATRFVVESYVEMTTTEIKGT